MEIQTCTEEYGLGPVWTGHPDEPDIVYHIEPLSFDAANSILDGEVFSPTTWYVIETIVWLFTDDDNVFKQKRFVLGSLKALAVAAEIAAAYDKQPEDIVAIRLCTLEEYDVLEKVYYHRMAHPSLDYMTDAEAEALPEVWPSSPPSDQ